MEDFPPFPGFQPAAFTFLKELAQNNDRDWFKPRKATYDDEVLWPLRCLLAEVARESAVRGLGVTADPKKSIFRIYRDVRFSKNKDPYKTHVAAVMARDSSKNPNGVVYIHIQPNNCFIGAGFWRPESKLLRAWRERMVDDPDGFIGIINQLGQKDTPVSGDESLKRLPRGFEAAAGSPIEPYLKWKSFVCSRQLPDKALQSPTLVQEMVKTAEDVQPLLQYGWEVMDAL